MSLRLLVRLGLRSLRLHKLRSSLSILGVVFGVAAVVAMSSVGEGARRQTLAQIASLGIDSVTVRPRPLRRGEPQAGHPAGRGGAVAAALVVPGIRAVAPVRVAELPAETDGRQAAAIVIGTTPEYREAVRLSLAAGRFLADLDVADSKRVTVLGASLARRPVPSRQPARAQRARGRRLLPGRGRAGRARLAARTGPRGPRAGHQPCAARPAARPRPRR